MEYKTNNKNQLAKKNFTFALAMQPLNLPEIQYKSRTNSKGKVEVLDTIRNKYIVLTPEENVRQHFIHYLIQDKEFPASLMAVEKGLKVNHLQKRTDIVQYAKDGKPLVIIECKAPQIKINEDTFAQAAMYNIKMKVKYLIITNGIEHFCCKVNYQTHKLEYLKSIPNYNEL